MDRKQILAAAVASLVAAGISVSAQADHHEKGAKGKNTASADMKTKAAKTTPKKKAQAETTAPAAADENAAAEEKASCGEDGHSCG